MPTLETRMRVIILFLLIAAPLNASSASVPGPTRNTPNGPITIAPTPNPRSQGRGFLYPLYKNGGGVRGKSMNRLPKQPAEAAEMPLRPLPQIMLPKNVTTDALKAPFGAVLVAPPPRKLVEVDVCRGYYDVMGQYDLTFNCSKGDFIYCCGTCHYRFCCPHRSQRLDQNICHNYHSPVWANTAPPASRPSLPAYPDLSRIEQSNNTVYVIGGVISFTVAVAVAIKVAFHKASRQPRNRELNMPRWEFMILIKKDVWSTLNYVLLTNYSYTLPYQSSCRNVASPVESSSRGREKQQCSLGYWRRRWDSWTTPEKSLSNTTE